MSSKGEQTNSHVARYTQHTHMWLYHPYQVHRLYQVYRLYHPYEGYQVYRLYTELGWYNGFVP